MAKGAKSGECHCGTPLPCMKHTPRDEPRKNVFAKEPDPLKAPQPGEPRGAVGDEGDDGGAGS